ncbi:MAG TPA: hypothetical protein VFD05_04255 [Bacilli bacterium]|nr:hypothetical protein [Bacilli bacterium]
MYNKLMEVFLWIVVGLAALYLLLTFVFMHLSLEYRKKIKNSDEVIDSHIKSHISLLDLLINDVNSHVNIKEKISLPFFNDDKTKLIKQVQELDELIRKTITEHNLSFLAKNNYLGALDENTKLLRDEVYRHNSYVQNFNIICGSFIFWPIVKILRLQKKDKY